MEWDWKRRETGQEKANTGLFSWQKRQLFTGKSWNGAGGREKRDDKGPTNGFLAGGWWGKGGLAGNMRRTSERKKNGKKSGFWRGVGEERELEGGWMGKLENGSSANSLPTFKCSEYRI